MQAAPECYIRMREYDIGCSLLLLVESRGFSYATQLSRAMGNFYRINALILLSALGLAANKWPPDTFIPNNGEFTADYVVVGAGTAGSIIGFRLTEDPNVDVVMVEAGDDPPTDAELPGLFFSLPKTKIDWNYTSEDDGYSAQYHRNKFVDLPSGKVLGGSSSLHHFYYLRGDAADFEDWVKASGNESWSLENLLPYFKKSERLEDKDISDSETGNLHGYSGEVGITRRVTELPEKYLQAFQEVGHPVVLDINGHHVKGFTQPLFFIAEKKRQSSAEGYLTRAKSRDNLHLVKNTIANRILFDSNNNAIGVECASLDGRVFKVFARKEVVISAGAFNTPKLLKLSGIGPRAELESFGIKVISDLPVGENLQDHLAVVLAHGLEKTNDTPSAPILNDFPLDTFVGLESIDPNQEKPDYLTLNLICRNNPECLSQLCSVVFGLNQDVCNQIMKAGEGREILVSILTVCRPVSTGRVLLKSSDPKDPPVIYTGFLSNKTDLENSARYIEDFIRVVESKYFKSVGGETLQPHLPNCSHLQWNTREYWKCYVLNMMDTTFHYSSTCPMGSVLDSQLRVRGVGRLRVGDASAMPNIVSSNINAAVMVLAEKLADLLKESGKQ
ncbi:ecdysone oxidase-like [Danaus plexippus]|uniref:ecdysone oxidase-like n=1 Tax=Danaus plexippus TaxID=13037 RepID=UPI002AB08EC3|nr:ecdysone oxidase-like [Danaus plexippus]